MYGDKIRTFRTLRGFTQEYMADQLHVAQNTYSKYENNSEKLSIELLDKIAKALGVSVTDLISNTPIIINNQTSNQGSQGIGHVENLHTDQRDMYSKIIDSKDDEIRNLRDVIIVLKELIAKISLGK